MSRPLFHCLIRTHHITSRKKVQRVRREARQLQVDWVLVRTGGPPGIMFAEAGDAAALAAWVATVQALRYKDFRCAVPPEPAPSTALERPLLATGFADTGFAETASVAEFAKHMELRGLTDWWKRGMGYGTEGGG